MLEIRGLNFFKIIDSPMKFQHNLTKIIKNKLAKYYLHNSVTKLMPRIRMCVSQ